MARASPHTPVMSTKSLVSPRMREAFGRNAVLKKLAKLDRACVSPAEKLARALRI